MRITIINNLKRGHILIKALGIAAIILLLLVNITYASPFAYVVNKASASVSVINTATNRVIKNISVGFNPCGITFSPDGKKVYVVGYQKIFVIDTTTYNISKIINVGTCPCHIVFNSDGTKMYIVDDGISCVYVMNTATYTVKKTVYPSIYGSFNEDSIAKITPDGKKLYVAHDNNTISVIDTTTNKKITDVKVGFLAVDIEMISSIPIPPVADFTAAPLKGKSPLTVKFKDTSTGSSPKYYLWTIVSGSPFTKGYEKITSTDEKPIITLLKAGIYNIQLQVTNAVGSSFTLTNPYNKITVT